MCDKCELDMAMYGEVRGGFRCSEVSQDLLDEQHNGIPRFAGRKPAASPEVEGGDRAETKIAAGGDAKAAE